jgi:Ran GTPase-activating protein (RanGAP) involved in mRNA processing and transport
LQFFSDMWEEAYCAACGDVGAEVRDELRTSGTTGALTARGNTLVHFTHRLTDTDVAAVVAALRSCTGVSSMCVPYNNITDRGGVLLGEALAQSVVPLVTLDLRYNSLGVEAAVALARGVEHNVSLSTLLLAGNPLGAQCGPSLGLALRHNTSLTSLDLNSTDMGMPSLVPLCRALEANRSLVSLDIGRPLLRGPDEVSSVVEHLADALKVNHTLEELNVSHFGITDSDLQRLVVALCASAVSTLSVKGNKLSEDAGQLLSRLLERRHDFKQLDVSCNRLRDRGATDLAKGVAQHPQLASLRMQSCTMGETGLVAMIAGLRSCAALRELTLWGNDITPVVAQAFSRAFGDLRKVESTDFGVEQRDGEWVAYCS